MEGKRNVILLLMASVCKSEPTDKGLEDSGKSIGQAPLGNTSQSLLWNLVVPAAIFALMMFILFLWAIMLCCYPCRRSSNDDEEGRNRSETEPILRPGGHRSLATRQETPRGRRRGDRVARHQRNRESPSAESVSTIRGQVFGSNRSSLRSNSTKGVIPQRPAGAMATPDILTPSGPHSSSRPVPGGPWPVQTFDPRVKGLQRSPASYDLSSSPLAVPYGPQGLVLANPHAESQISSSCLPGSPHRVISNSFPGPSSMPHYYSGMSPLTSSLPSRPLATMPAISFHKPSVDRKAKPSYMTRPVADCPPPCKGGIPTPTNLAKLDKSGRPVSDGPSVKKETANRLASSSLTRVIQLRPEYEEIFPWDMQIPDGKVLPKVDTDSTKQTSSAQPNQDNSDAKKSIPEELSSTKPNQNEPDAKKSISEELVSTKPNQNVQDAKISVLKDLASAKLNSSAGLNQDIPDADNSIQVDQTLEKLNYSTEPNHQRPDCENAIPVDQERPVAKNQISDDQTSAKARDSVNQIEDSTVGENSIPEDLTSEKADSSDKPNGKKSVPGDFSGEFVSEKQTLSAKPNQDEPDAKNSNPEELVLEKQIPSAKPNQDEPDAINQVPRSASPEIEDLQKSQASIPNFHSEPHSVSDCFTGVQPLKDSQNRPRAVSDGLITAIPASLVETPVCSPNSPPPIPNSPVPLIHIPASPSRNFYTVSGMWVPYHRPGFYLGGYDSE